MSAANLSGNRQLSVKLKQLRLGQVKRDLLLKEKAAQVELERVLLQAEAELAEAQFLVEAELQEDRTSQCLSEMDERAITYNENVEQFLNENSAMDNLMVHRQRKDIKIPVQGTAAQKSFLRADAPEWKSP